MGDTTTEERAPTLASEAIGARIAELLDELGDAGDPRAEELVALVTELHHEGLERALLVIADGPGGRAALESLGDDEVVGGLLVLHDLHPHDLATRVARALGRIKSEMGGARAHVEVDVADEDQGVHLSVTFGGGATTPSYPIATLIERVVGAAAPEAAQIVVTVSEPPPAVTEVSAVPVDLAPRQVPVAIRPRVERHVPGERCDLCAAPVGERHRHLVDVDERRLLCACQGCGLLFDHDTGPRVLGFPLSEPLAAGYADGVRYDDGTAVAATSGATNVKGGRRYRGLPERCLALPRPGLSPALWASLQIPVGVAFLFHSTGQGGVVAFYPSPAGATESLLPLDAWEELLAEHPVLSTLESDVEALLVRNERGDADGEAYVVPIDVCYELVGHLRSLWRGFDGGSEARARLDQLFDGIRGRADVAMETSA